MYQVRVDNELLDVGTSYQVAVARARGITVKYHLPVDLLRHGVLMDSFTFYRGGAHRNGPEDFLPLEVRFERGY